MVFKAVKMIFSENYQHIQPAKGQNFQPAQKLWVFGKKKLSRDLKLPRPPKFKAWVFKTQNGLQKLDNNLFQVYMDFQDFKMNILLTITEIVILAPSETLYLTIAGTFLVLKGIGVKD